MTRIILDTDPGIDDALALFLALASPEVQLEAVTTVNGNVSVDFTTLNALALLELAQRPDIPVARGSDRPLLRSPVYADYVHGSRGLGYLELPAPRHAPVTHHAVTMIIDTIMNAPGEITLVPIGPLTNIALAVRREPRIAGRVREVVIMGGALRVPGNTTPTAEFNIYADPHAAHVVFHAGWPLRLVSLDTTRQVELHRDQVDALAASGSPITAAIKQMLGFYFDVFAPAYGVGVFHMHDPLCLAAAFLPDLLTWQPTYVDVELQGVLTLGQTVAYFRDPDARPPNMQVAVAVAADRFMQLFLERIQARFG